MKKIKLIILAFTVLSFSFVNAQESTGKGAAENSEVGDYFSKFRPAKKWSAGLQLGPTFYSGEADNFQPGFSFGAHVKYSVSQSFGLKAYGDIGTLKGARENQRVSNNSNDVLTNSGNQKSSEDSYEFENKFRDLNLVAVYTLGNISFLRPLRKIQVFTFFGVGAVWSNAVGTFSGEDARRFYEVYGDLFSTPLDNNGDEISAEDAAADISAIQTAETSFTGRNLTIPYGIGFKRNFGNRFDLGLEWRMNWTRSDNLDALSAPIWRNRFFDQYAHIGLQGSFKFGNKDNDDHYDWLNPIETIYAELDSMKKITNDLKTLIEDADGDGIGDFFDEEDSTDCDKVYGNGIAIDSDNDGVNDCKDLELFSACPEVDENGKALDNDGDGVPNCLDEEPNSAEGGLVDAKGVAVEMNTGGGACCNCENVVLPTVIFDNNSSRISPSSYGVLYTIAEKMKSCPGLNIAAKGYTSSKSGEQLAYKRVTSIVDHLEANYGIERSRLSTTYSAGSGVEHSSKRIDLSQKK